MALSTALDLSRTSLATISQLTEISSRNVANVGIGSASRKTANLVTDAGGAARVTSITRAALQSLRDVVMTATSDSARLGVISDALDRLDLTGGTGDQTQTPASRLGTLAAALHVFSANTADQNAAGDVLNAAHQITDSLHEWACNIVDVRQQADASIKVAVDRVNVMLAQYAALDTKIVNGTISGIDITDQLDARDALIKGIADEVGLTVVARSNNSIGLYTDSGITLFDGAVRTVSFAASPLADATVGAAVVIDGLPAVGSSSSMPVQSGRIAGLIEVRDGIALTLAAQFDDIATGLVRAFAETDQSAVATLPPLAGLFTTAVMTNVPADGSQNPALARAIIVNPNADPAQGGDMLRLRDGGISQPGNPAYAFNAAQSSGFNGRAQQLIASLSQIATHDPATALTAPASVTDFAAASVGWLNAQRKAATETGNYAASLLQRAQDSLDKQAGINIDDEMTNLLGLERAYQATAKLISTIDNMFGALMEAVR